MLKILNQIPEGFLDVKPEGLMKLLGGPTLIHLAGKREPPLFISAMLHGNEDVGLKAVQRMLLGARYAGLPRSVSIFIGNVAAASQGLRRLDTQPDYNRVWNGGVTPEHRMAEDVVEQMRSRTIFAAIDLHNNTGNNPHYGCVTSLDHQSLDLVAMFSRIAVFFTMPDRVICRAFAQLGPSVTLECGKTGLEAGVTHAAEFLTACLHLSEIPSRPMHTGDLRVYHTLGVMKIPLEVAWGFGDTGFDLCLPPTLDQLNFADLAPGAPFAGVGKNIRSGTLPIEVWDDTGKNAAADFFEIKDGALRTRRAVVPAMLSLDERVIRQDCLGYLMEDLGDVRKLQE